MGKASMGVIDAIAEGCFAVARRPYLLLLPVLLDLFYWVADRLTAAPLVEALIATAQRGGSLDAATLDGLRSFERQSDLFGLLALGIRALLPELTPGAVARPWPQGTLDLGAWPLVVLVALGLALVGLFALALYLSGLGQVVRGEAFDLRRLAGRAPVYWLRLLGLIGIVVGALLLVGMPLLVLAGVLTVLGANPGPLLLLFFVPLVWIYCFLALAPEAIVVSEAGPLRAIKLSVRVVRRNFWPVLGLLGATLLISQGFPVLWQALARQLPGVPLAIAGNAFLATGLTAAAMYFYRERVQALGETVEGREARGEGREAKGEGTGGRGA
jgi:hypothetical protein